MSNLCNKVYWKVYVVMSPEPGIARSPEFDFPWCLRSGQFTPVFSPAEHQHNLS